MNFNAEAMEILALMTLKENHGCKLTEMIQVKQELNYERI
jgi:hypothetical protein